MGGIFITGVGTGVGKTYFSKLLYDMLHSRLSVAYMKPIETGVVSYNPVQDEGGLHLSDYYAVTGSYAEVSIPMSSHFNQYSALISDKKGQTCILSPLAHTPYTLQLPISPHLAAQLDGVKVFLPVIGDCYYYLKQSHDFVIVEGAGGALSPISHNKLSVDLVRFLGLSAIIVMMNKVGAVHDTLSTLEAMKSRGITVLGFVANHRKEYFEPNDTPIDYIPKEMDERVENYVLSDNIKTIERYSGVPCIAKVYSCGHFEDGEQLLKTMGIH